MIQSNQFQNALVGLQTQRSSPLKIASLDQLSFVKDRSLVCLTYRKNDHTCAIAVQPNISPIGELGLKVQTIQIPRSTADDENIIDERSYFEKTFFQIVKVDSNDKEGLKYNEKFYLLHHFTKLYLTCKQTINSIIVFYLQSEMEEKAQFLFLPTEEENVSHGFVSANKNLKISNNYFDKKLIKVLSSHNITKNCICLSNEFTTFNVKLYRTSESSPILTKTSYVQIFIGDMEHKLRIKTINSFLDSDFNEPYNRFFKPDNFQLVSDNCEGTVWKVELKSIVFRHNCAHIKYGDNVSFKCMSTNLYLSYQPESQTKFSLESDPTKPSTVFKIDKIINKMNEYNDFQESSIWLQSPIEINGSIFYLKERAALFGLPLLYNHSFEPSLKELEQFKRLLSNISTTKHSEPNEHIIRDQSFILGKCIRLFQQLYTKIINQILIHSNMEILFSKSMIWLHVISKKSISYERKSQETMCQAIQGQFQILTQKILEYIYACIPHIQSSEFEKQTFYQIILFFLPEHKFIIHLIFIESQKRALSRFSYNYLFSTINFYECLTDKFQANSIKILRKLLNMQHIRSSIKFPNDDNLSISLVADENDVLTATFFVDDYQVFSSELYSKINGTIYDCIIIGLYLNKFFDHDLEQLIKTLKVVYARDSSDNQLRSFILSVFNFYFSRKVSTQTIPACLKYGSTNHDSKAFEMFITSPLQGALYQCSILIDSIVDSTINIFSKKDTLFKTRNIVEYLDFMQEFLSFIEYYTVLGNYTISRLLELVHCILQCCETLNSFEAEEFAGMIENLKSQKKIYIKYQVQQIEVTITKIIVRQTHLLDSWLLHPSKMTKIEEELVSIKRQAFKLIGIVKNQPLFNSIKELSMVRTHSQIDYTFIKQKYFRKKEYSKIAAVKEIVGVLFDLFEKLQTTHNQFDLKNSIEEGLRNMDQLISELNKQFKGQHFQLFHMQNVIRENGVYKQLCEFLLYQSKTIVNFDWKSIILFLCNFIIGNPTNARLLLPCKFQELLIGDQLDVLITEIFIYAESAQEIMRLEKRFGLARDIRHRIKFFRILLTLANKVEQESVQSRMTNKITIFEMLMRIKGFVQLVKSYGDTYRCGNQSSKQYQNPSQQLLELHKVLIYLICQLSRSTPIVMYSITKWFPVEEMVEIASKPSEIYWEIIKPYIYILNTTLDQQHINTINHISLTVLRNFSSQLHRTVKTLIVYDDTFSKLHVWSILDKGMNNFESQFPIKDTANSLTLFPRNDEHFWKLFYSMEEECLKFGILTFIKSILQYHNQKQPLSNELINEIVQLNVLFEGYIWILDEIEKVKEEEEKQVTFICVKKLLNFITSTIKQLDSNAPNFIKQQDNQEDIMYEEELIEQQSITSLKPLFREERKNKSNPMSQPTRHQLRKILKHQTQQNLAESPIELFQQTLSFPKLCIQEILCKFYWQNITLYLDLANLRDLYFLKQFIQAYTSYIQKNYNLSIQKFLFRLSQKLKKTQFKFNSVQFSEYLICKLQILKLILQIVFKFKNQKELQSDFQIFSLMLRNTFNFVLKSKCEWKILIEVTSICTIYLSCVKQPISQIRLLQQTFNNSNNQLERLQLITKLFSTSMDIQGQTAFELLMHPKLCQSLYIAVIQLCLKEELCIQNYELPIVFEMLEVILQFNLFVTEKLNANIFDSQYFNLLCELKNKIVKDVLLQNIHNLTEYKTLSPNYVQPMNENDFSLYLLLILITIENVCEMVIPPNEKYIFNSSSDSFHFFYQQHLSEIEISYKGKNITVCYPKFFNSRNKQIKEFALDITKFQERRSFDTIMKAAEFIQSGDVQFYESIGIITFVNEHTDIINVMNLVFVCVSTLVIAMSDIKYLEMQNINIVSFCFLFASLLISVLKCSIGMIRYIRETVFQKKLIQKPQSSTKYKRFQDVFYCICTLIFTIFCFVYKYLIGFLLLMAVCQRFSIKMHDSFLSEYTKKIFFIGISMVTAYMIFFQLSYPVTILSTIVLNTQTIQRFFSSITLFTRNSDQSLAYDVLFKIAIAVYVPAVLYSFLIINKIAQMNTLNIFKCYVCQRVFNHNSFSKHSIHKLSNYISYFSFILARQQPLNKLEEYSKLYITNNDIGIFPQ